MNQDIIQKLTEHLRALCDHLAASPEFIEENRARLHALHAPALRDAERLLKKARRSRIPAFRDAAEELFAVRARFASLTAPPEEVA